MKISRAWIDGERVSGGVAFEQVERAGPFGSLTEERNGVMIEQRDGQRHFVHGRGAGRWPTTESVMADVLDTFRCRLRAA